MELNATFIVSTISFIVFVFIMNAIFYKPLENIVKERNEFIDDHHAQAADATNKSFCLLKDRDEKLSKAGKDARKLMIDSAEKAKEEKAKLYLKTKTKTTEEIKTEKEKLNNSSKEATNTLKNSVALIAETISSKILGENTTIKEVDNSIVDKIMHEG